MKLTPARHNALQLVAEGAIDGHWPNGPRQMQWKHGHFTLRRSSYDWLRLHGYIAVQPARHGRSEVHLTDRGRGLVNPEPYDITEDSDAHLEFQAVSGVDETDPDYLERFGLWVAELGAEHAISECEGTGR